MTKPRVMMSGTPSSAPVCLLMATTGTTRPSSARCRRSRSTSSPTSPVRVPSISTRPTGALPASRAPVPSNCSTSPFSARSTSGFGSRPGEHAAGDPRVLRQLAVLAVDRHEVARPDQRQHQLQLFLAAVARDVDVLDALVDDVGAAPREVVHHAADRLLVARESRAPTARPCRPVRPSRGGGRRSRCATAPTSARPASRCVRHSTSCAG